MQAKVRWADFGNAYMRDELSESWIEVIYDRETATVVNQ